VDRNIYGSLISREAKGQAADTVIKDVRKLFTTAGWQRLVLGGKMSGR